MMNLRPLGLCLFGVHLGACALLPQATTPAPAPSPPAEPQAGEMSSATGAGGDDGAGMALVTGLERSTGLAPPTAVSQTDAEAVAAVVADFHRSLRENYKDGALRLLDPTAVIFETGYAERRDDYAARHLDADLLFAATVEREPLHTSVLVSGDLAYVLTQARSHGTFHGNRVDLNNAETMVLRRNDGQWKIVHVHWSAHERAPGGR
jgi:ketosteroid isomerase-like protein